MFFFRGIVFEQSLFLFPEIVGKMDVWIDGNAIFFISDQLEECDIWRAERSAWIGLIVQSI